MIPANVRELVVLAVDPEVPVWKIAAVVGHDPVLAEQVMRMAQEIATPENAVAANRLAGSIAELLAEPLPDDPAWRRRLSARVDQLAVVLREGASVTERELQEFVSARAAAFKVPKKIVFLAEIPKGATGKLQRIGLAAKLGLG